MSATPSSSSSIPAHSTGSNRSAAGASTQQQQGVRFNGSNANTNTNNGNGNGASRHRRSSSKANNNSTGGNKRSNSTENAKTNKLSSAETEIVVKHMDDRTLYLLSSAIGSKCIVTVASGTRYIGLLYTTSSFSEGGNLSIVLKLPELYSLSPDDELDPNDELPETLIVDFKDFADLEILDLDLTADPVSTQKESGTTFKTDSDISSSRVATEQRELEKWVPEESEELLGGGGLEDGPSDTKNWDQFAVNERKFGIQSSFDENLYTTKISKDDPLYKERLAVAEKLAHEIENSSYNGNVHLAEERGIVVDDSGVDEEDKYSGVDRRGEELMAALRKAPNTTTSEAVREPTPNKYLPPRFRAAQYHDDPAVLSSSGGTNNAPKVEEEKKKLPATLPHKPSSSTVKQTFNSETSRINAQSEINALKEFSATFKIPTKFPKDLLPIVTKDKSKQEEILKKFEEEAEEKRKKELAEKKALSSASSSNSTSTTVTAPVKKKMDPKTAITFKMNPNSASFTPSNFTPPSALRGSFGNKSPVASQVSPRPAQVSPSKKNITPQGFFGARVPKEVKSGEVFIKSFNYFDHVGSLEHLEKPFVTPPTWEQEVDESYISFFSLVPEKISISLGPPPPPSMRYMQSPLGAPPPQLIPAVAPLSPHHAHSPISIQTPMHPQQVPIMMPPNFNGPPEETNRNLSPSPQAIPPYYPGFPPNVVVPPPPQQQQQPSPQQNSQQQQQQPPPSQQQQSQQQPQQSPRAQRHSNSRHNHHHHNNNNNGQAQYNQQAAIAQAQMAAMAQGQYPMVYPMPPQGGAQYGRGAPAGNYPAMGYYIVGPPNGGRQF